LDADQAKAKNKWAYVAREVLSRRKVLIGNIACHEDGPAKSYLVQSEVYIMESFDPAFAPHNLATI
jgi:hypothetical protein